MDDKEISESIFITDKMSPTVVFGIISAISLFTIYNTRNNLEKIQSTKSMNIIELYTWYEVSFIIVCGILLFGLGQYKEKSLSWILLMIPIITIALKTILVFITVSNLYKQLPTDQVPTITLDENIPTVSDLSNKLSNDVLKQQLITKTKQMSSPLNPTFSPPLGQPQDDNSQFSGPIGFTGSTGF